MFLVSGVKIIGRVGLQKKKKKNSGKNIILCILEGEILMPFKMNIIIFFSENLKKNSGFTSKFRYVGLPLTQVFFSLAS